MGRIDIAEEWFLRASLQLLVGWLIFVGLAWVY